MRHAAADRLRQRRARAEKTGRSAALFSEELGAVLQVRRNDLEAVLKTLSDAGLGHLTHDIGTLTDDDHVRFDHAGRGYTTLLGEADH